MRIRYAVAALAALFYSSYCLAQTPSKSIAPPNIILVMVDDLGARSLNSGRYKIPHLDRMAAQGMMFRNAFSMPLCGPTRATIMSGRYAFRSGVGNNQGPTGFTAPWGSKGGREVTFGNLLRDQGYATAIAGKWAMCKFNYSPNHLVECGFDNYRMWPKIYKDEMQPRYWGYVKYQDGTYSTAGQDEYGPDDEYRYLMDFVRKNKEKPFFAYWPMTLMHGPLAAPPELKDAPDKWVANVSYIDILIGRLMDNVDKLGLGEKTLILFTTDNGSGGGKHGSGKGKLDDRGTHVPLIARWKNTVKAGSVSEDLVDFTDFLSTFADLAGAELPKDRVIDGRSFAPQLLGQKSDPRDSVYFQIGSGIKVRGHKYAVDQSGALYDLTDRYNYQLIAASSYTEEQKGVQQRLFKALEEIAGSGGANATSKDATSRYKGEPLPDAAAHPENVRAFKVSHRKPARSRFPVKANLQSGLEDGTPHGRKSEENLLSNGSFADGAPTKANAGFDSAATFDVPNWKDSPGGSYGKSVKSNGINMKAGGWFSFFKKGNAGAEQITGHSLAEDEKLVFTFKYEAVTAQARGKESCLVELFYADNGASKTLVRTAFDTDAGPGTWISDRFLELDMKQFPEAVGKSVGVRIGFNPASSCSGWIRVSNVALSSGASEPPKVKVRTQPTVSVSEPLSTKPMVEPPVSGLDEMQAKTGSSDYPNILFIISDDHGWGDLPSNWDKTEVQMPRLDALANSGTRFTNYHTVPLCAPSRACLFTGQFTSENGMWRGPGGVPGEPGYKGIKRDVKMLSEYLSDAGYATGCFGKWHMGAQPGEFPNDRGFDEFRGFLSGSSAYWIKKERSKILHNGKPDKTEGHTTELFTKWSADFIRENAVKEKPFFCYLSFNAVHGPIRTDKSKPSSAPKEWVDKAVGRGVSFLRSDYVAVLEHMDYNIGKLVDLLDELKIRENTLIVFVSDNGACQMAEGPGGRFPGNNGAFRGCKGTTYQGGLSVPFLMNWQNQFPEGAISDSQVMHADVFATLLDVAGIPLPKMNGKNPMRGMSLISHMKSGGQTAIPERTMIFELWGNVAIRKGNYKLWGDVGRDFSPDWQALVAKLKKSDLILFDLSKDIGEQNDLRTQLPEVYASLKKELVDHFINVNAEYPSAKTHPELFAAYKNVPELPAKKSRKKTAPKSTVTKPGPTSEKSGRKNAFVAMDSNGNGKVTLEELDGWFKNRAEKNPDKFTYKAEQARAALVKQDTNKDDELTLEEWTK